MTVETLERPAARRRSPSVRRAHTASRAEFEARVRQLLSRRPAVGLALGVVRDGHLDFFHGHGLADVASRTPVTEDTVFRVGSITKLFTAIAVMQLVEGGLLDLDAPAHEYLRAYRLVEGNFRPPTARHLLTHTSGISDLRHVLDLLHSGLTPGDGRPPLLNVPFGEALPSLAEYYRDGLRVVGEPGSTFAYCNHGFATLGQIVEDVSGAPLERYFREHIFEPLGMVDTGLARSAHLAARLATGYVVRRNGPAAVPDRDWIGAAAGGVYSTPRDLARFATALLRGGANEDGTILQPATLATMFEPHYRPDPRLPGMGLGFFRGEAGGHRLVYHDGILPGFNSELLLAPDDGVAAIGLTNGSPGAFAWMETELDGMLRQALGAAEGVEPSDMPQHPEVWQVVCGRYAYLPGAPDLRERLALGGGAEVFVGGGRLMVRILTPLPALYAGLPLVPDDPTDPYVFRLDLRPYGMSSVRIVFAGVVDGRATLVHTDLGGQPWSFVRVPDRMTSRAWLVAGGLAMAGIASAFARARRTSA